MKNEIQKKIIAKKNSLIILSELSAKVVAEKNKML
jgi:hypothetical protein